MKELLMESHKTRHSSDKALDLNQTLDRSFMAGQDKMILLASNLKPKNQEILSLVAAHHKFKVLTTDR